MPQSTQNENGRERAPAAARASSEVREANSHQENRQQTTQLVEQAEALRTSLRAALVATGELVRGLRRHRRQSRLVETTLASLRQLQEVK